MGNRSTDSLPPRLERLRGRFERWRSRRQRATERIPEALWGAAVERSAKYGVYKTARPLRLDSSALKKRVEASRSSRSLSAQERPFFVQIAAPRSTETPRCVVELEDSSGAKMRLEVFGVGAAELGVLARSFLDARR